MWVGKAPLFCLFLFFFVLFKQTLTASHQAAQLLFHAALILLQPLELLLFALHINTQLADLSKHTV